MIVCRAASVWPPPAEVTEIVCMRCQQNAPALQILSAIWIDKFNYEEDCLHEWAAQLLCEPCATAAVPHEGAKQ